MPNNKRLPEVIYIRRRVAAVVVLVVVAGLLVWLGSMFAGGNKKTEGDPSAVATTATPTRTTESASEDSEASGASGASTSGSESESEAASSSLAAPSEAESTEPKANQAAKDKKSCELRDLVISARSDQNSFGSGEQPRFYMTVENPTAADCDIDLTEQALRFEVYDLATNKRIWSDMDCNPAEDTNAVFPAGEQRYFEVIWSRTSSAPNSCKDREQVPDGGYYLYTLVGDNHSDPITFNLHGA